MGGQALQDECILCCCLTRTPVNISSDVPLGPSWTTDPRSRSAGSQSRSPPSRQWKWLRCREGPQGAEGTGSMAGPLQAHSSIPIPNRLGATVLGGGGGKPSWCQRPQDTPPTYFSKEALTLLKVSGYKNVHTLNLQIHDIPVLLTSGSHALYKSYILII